MIRKKVSYLIIIMVIITAFISCDKSSNFNALNQDPETINLKNENILYKNSKYNFTSEYPSSMIVTSSPDALDGIVTING